MSEAIRDGLSNKETTSTVFLDFASAFDSVWHYDRIYKRVSLGVCGPMMHVGRSYLSARSSSVRIGAIRAVVRPIFSCAPHDPLLGPDLFNVYSSDRSRELGTSLAVYADDTAVYTSFRNEAAAIAGGR